MSGKSGYPGSQQLDINGLGLCMVAGRFPTTSSGDPTIIAGKGFSVVRTNTGRYTVTLARAFMEIVSIVTGIALETAGTELVTSVDQDSITTSVFEIDIANLSGTAADDAGSEVHFILVGRYTSIDY